MLLSHSRRATRTKRTQTTAQVMLQVKLSKLRGNISQLGVMLEIIADAQALHSVDAGMLRDDEQRLGTFVTHVNERLEAWCERIRPIAELVDTDV